VKKPVVKKVAKKTAKKAIVMPPVRIVAVPSEVTVESPAPTEWRVTKGRANVTWIEKKDDPWFRLLGHAAVGVGARDPHFSGLLGLRAHFPKVRLGAEAYSAFAFGFGLQGMVYPVQSKDVNWHLNLGVIGFGSQLLSTQDVPRTWDLTAGTGVEIKLVKHLSLAIDWRMSIPSPVFIAGHSNPLYVAGKQILGPDGKYLHVGNVMGNSLTQSQLLVGLLFY
jgi:hypothetical protein